MAASVIKLRIFQNKFQQKNPAKHHRFTGFFIISARYQKPLAFLIYNSKAPVMEGAFGSGA